MNKRNLISITIITILLSISVGSGVAQETQPLSPNNPDAVALTGVTPWFLQHVDGAADNSVGVYPAIAFSPRDGSPYISYYNSTPNELWLASPVSDATGNCGVGNNWWCRMVDTDGDVGKYSSIDMWKSSTIVGRWKLGISYYDTSDRALKAAIYTCPGFIGLCSWEIGIVQMPTIATQSIGLSTSFKFTSQGDVGIAYYFQDTAGNDAVRYANQVDSGGNCGIGGTAGLWNCENADSGDRVGQYPSLDFRWDDDRYITYYDEGNGDLKYAYFGGIGYCGTANAWICGRIDNTVGEDVGLYSSLVAPQFSGDVYRVAYYDKANGQLKIAYSVASGGNCANTGWVCYRVDDMDTNINNAIRISLAADVNGHPIIAYQKTSDVGPATLQIARFAYDIGLMVGNCGDVPPGYLFMAWQCDTIDSASAYTSEGDFVSVAVNSAGLAAIAYTDSDEYDMFNNLKVAYQLLNLYLPVVGRGQ
jgi:hypothetical protein